MDATKRLLPPISNTGVETVSVGVAWLGGSLRTDEDAAVGWDLVRLLGGASTMNRETAYYGKGVHADDGGWLVGWDGRGSNRGTVLLTVRQARLEADDGLLLVLGLLARGVRPSRLDLAGDDLRPSAPRPRDYFDRRDDCWTRTHRARWVLTESGDGRQTLNVGSRTSDRFLRLYDHAPGCLRHELELKGDTARSAGAALGAGTTPATLWTAEYGRLVRWAL